MYLHVSPCIYLYLPACGTPSQFRGEKKRLLSTLENRLQASLSPYISTLENRLPAAVTTLDHDPDPNPDPS